MVRTTAVMKLALPLLAVAVLAGEAWWQVTAPPPVDAAVPPVLAQGFSDIVKKVTPAVVNIAVTGSHLSVKRWLLAHERALSMG